jgi:hypothetical protein
VSPIASRPVLVIAPRASAISTELCDVVQPPPSRCSRATADPENRRQLRFFIFSSNPYPGRLVAVILSREKVPVTPERAFDTYHEVVFRFVYRLTRRADVAKDVTWKCFLTLVRAPGRFNEARGSLKTYLFAIARNRALKHHRDRAADVQLDEDAIGHRTPEGRARDPSRHAD